MNPIISIIIPVYNAEKDLLHALKSVSEQTYRPIEVCAINDCSTDQSARILADFAQKCSDICVKISTHTSNRGVAAARNTGLSLATGKYIYYVDADDTLEPNALELLVKEAEDNNLDIIGHDWILEFEKNGRYMRQRDFSTPHEAVENLMYGVMRWNLWLFMTKRSLYTENGIRFTEGMNMGEDMMVTIKLFLCAHKVGLLHQGLYHYRQCNEQSLTKVYSQHHIEQVTANVKEVEHFVNTYAPSYTPIINHLKLNIKLPLIISDNKEKFQLWRSWFIEANDVIWNNKYLPLRTRIVQWLAAKNQYWAVWLYYKVIYKFVYGILYK